MLTHRYIKSCIFSLPYRKKQSLAKKLQRLKQIRNSHLMGIYGF